MIPLGKLDDVVDVQRAFGGQEDLVNDLHVGFTSGIGAGRVAELAAAQRAQGAKLGQGCVFENIQKIIFGKRIHSVEERVVVMGHNIWYR